MSKHDESKKVEVEAVKYPVFMGDPVTKEELFKTPGRYLYATGLNASNAVGTTSTFTVYAPPQKGVKAAKEEAAKAGTELCFQKLTFNYSAPKGFTSKNKQETKDALLAQDQLPGYIDTNMYKYEKYDNVNGDASASVLTYMRGNGGSKLNPIYSGRGGGGKSSAVTETYVPAEIATEAVTESFDQNTESKSS